MNISELESLERELHTPQARRSRARLEQLLHPEFREIGRSGRQYSRDETIRLLIAGHEPLNIETTELSANTLTEGCMLLTYRSAQVSPDGTRTHIARRSSLWIRHNGGWQLYHHQATPAD